MTLKIRLKRVKITLFRLIIMALLPPSFIQVWLYQEDLRRSDSWNLYILAAVPLAGELGFQPNTIIILMSDIVKFPYICQICQYIICQLLSTSLNFSSAARWDALQAACIDLRNVSRSSHFAYSFSENKFYLTSWLIIFWKFTINLNCMFI